MTVQSIVKVISTTTATAETDINAVITTQEAAGFVLEDVKYLSDKVLLQFKNQSVLPGGGGIKKLELDVVFGDLSAAALTKVVALPSLPANITPLTATVNVTTPFVGAGVTNLDVEIGDTADPNGLQTSQNLLTSGVKGVAGAAYIQDVQNNMAPEALFTAQGANLDQLSAGAATLTVHYIEH